VEKKRVIVDHKNISNELIQLLMEKHPYGYDDAVIKFKNAKGEIVSAVPLETEDTKYLIKVSVALTKRVEDYLEEEENDADEIPEADGPDPEEDGEEDDD
jgi:DNA-directed RNA polymerase subunit delta